MWRKKVLFAFQIFHSMFVFEVDIPNWSDSQVSCADGNVSIILRSLPVEQRQPRAVIHGKLSKGLNGNRQKIQRRNATLRFSSKLLDKICINIVGIV